MQATAHATNQAVPLSSRPRARKLLPGGVTDIQKGRAFPVTPGQPLTIVSALVRFAVGGMDRSRAEEVAEQIETAFDSFQAEQGAYGFTPSNHELNWTTDDDGYGKQHRVVSLVFPVRWTIDEKTRTCPEFAQGVEVLRQVALDAGGLPELEVDIEFRNFALRAGLD